MNNEKRLNFEQAMLLLHCFSANKELGGVMYDEVLSMFVFYEDDISEGFRLDENATEIFSNFAQVLNGLSWENCKVDTLLAMGTYVLAQEMGAFSEDDEISVTDRVISELCKKYGDISFAEEYVNSSSFEVSAKDMLFVQSYLEM